MEKGQNLQSSVHENIDNECPQQKRCNKYKVLALYKFVFIPKEKVIELQNSVEKILRSVKARGTILLATEGINGTICYPCEGKDRDNVLTFFDEHEFFSGLRKRISFAVTCVFHRLKVKVKEEIVSMGKYCLKGTKGVMEEHIAKDKDDIIVGEFVKPGKDWDNLLMDPEVVVIDTRNKYEVEIGTFTNAINPNTDNFNQFPAWLDNFAADKFETHHDDKNIDEINICDRKVNGDDQGLNVNDEILTSSSSKKEKTATNARSTEPVPYEPPSHLPKRPKAVAMFCTGGIRCEKSTSYALTSGMFPKDVPIYHLDGGILAYLDQVPASESKWKGECFVFDQRVALSHGLKPSEKYISCHGCRRPISQEDKNDENYIEGVCCKNCNNQVTNSQKKRFEERQRQIKLAEQCGKQHIHDPKDKD